MPLAKFFRITACALICFNFLLWRRQIFQSLILERLLKPPFDTCSTTTYHKLAMLSMKYGFPNARQDTCVRELLDVAAAVDTSNELTLSEKSSKDPQWVSNRPFTGIQWIIVVQVHDRLNYLKELIGSLEKVRGIGDALVVFSHDTYSAGANAVVEAIHFCRTIQLLYPLRLELFQNFPNADAANCSHENKGKCRRSDQLRSPKVASLAQIKHHWWWKAIQVFEHIAPTMKYDGWVLFLEDDHYVSADLLDVIKGIVSKKDSICKSCEFLVLGNYNPLNTYAKPTHVGVVPWFSSLHNLGLAFNKSVWLEVRKHAKTFCTYNDYNWDWTLNYISMHVLPTRWMAIVAEKPRVFHVGDCGVHKTSGACTDMLAKVKQYLEKTFPPPTEVGSIEVHPMLPTHRKTSVPNGAWADVRDHLLCLWNLDNA
uniref:Alpha-1,6-mannosyl-glycoprotein 2-beta-N-acetylglucosaminyltransferase n=1 Tax=Trichuris muris TaxID=70415 RepID=A0A5S6QLA9_TRIMR